MNNRRFLLVTVLLASLLIMSVYPVIETFILSGFTLGLVVYELVLSNYYYYEEQVELANGQLRLAVREIARLKDIIEKEGKKID